jgi:hypothetical protein
MGINVSEYYTVSVFREVDIKAEYFFWSVTLEIRYPRELL